MDFNTKFDMGEVVHNIGKDYRREFVACAFCGGNGRIVGENEKKRVCPECYGRGGDSVSVAHEWMVKCTLTIGQVKIEYTGETSGTGNPMFSNYGPQDERYKEEYMCLETGIGSGSVHPAERLFRFENDAQAECDSLNAEEAEKAAGQTK